VFVHDRGNTVFELEDTGIADFTHDDLAHRYLWAGNQLLVDEAIESLTDTELNESRWALPKHFGTIRDWIDDDANVLDHAVYDSYGQRVNTVGEPVGGTPADWFRRRVADRTTDPTQLCCGGILPPMTVHRDKMPPPRVTARARLPAACTGG
jgi:hypothetical protein